MQEVVGEFTGKKFGLLFFRGTKPIDGVWATDNMVVPDGYGVGNHQMFVVNFQAASLVGEVPFRVKQFSSRCLNTKDSSGTTKNYLAQLEENLSQHKLIKKLGNLHIRYQKKRHFQRELYKLDRQSRDLMINTERRCHRIKSGRIPFSPESSLWIRCTQVYHSLLRYKEGLIWNQGNLKGAAR